VVAPVRSECDRHRESGAVRPYRLSAKTTLGMGRDARAPSHLAGFSPWFIPSCNPQEIPGLQNQQQALPIFGYLPTGRGCMNSSLSSTSVSLVVKEWLAREALRMSAGLRMRRSPEKHSQK